MLNDSLNWLNSVRVFYRPFKLQIQIQTKILTKSENDQMKKSKVQKVEKPSLSKKMTVPESINYSFHNYMNLTNQQYLYHSLKLLGITESQYLKETKLSMDDQIFGKSQSATTTKQFFFIVIKCMKVLCNQIEFEQIKMWYPPRSVNEQLEFKKTLFNLIQKLQMSNKVPKKLLLSKTFLMGETHQSKVVEFLRMLAEMALRLDYINKYSKNNKLIQIQFSEIQNPQAQPNDLNRFYIYPFTPSIQTQNPTMSQNEIESLKNVYKAHIQIYRKKILNLSNKYPKQQPISCSDILLKLVEQKQFSQKLNKKIPKQILSQNRAFDRRQIIDRSNHVWEQFDKLEYNFIQKTDIPVLKLEGQTDRILLKWQTSGGINKLHDINKANDSLKSLKKKCKERLKEFKKFHQQLETNLNTHFKPK